MAADWRALVDACATKRPATEIRRQLESVRDRWLGTPDPAATAASISGWLRSSADARTGLALEPGPGGSLRGWPTLRVFLLDLLNVLDPDQAVELGRQILAATDSAEEFAVALKPLTGGRPWRASDAELTSFLAQLLARRDWQDAQAAGFAEALDLARVTATPDTAVLLAKWLDRQPSLAAAGEMALHETAAQTPAAVIPALAGDPSLLATRPSLRASLMARAAVSDPAQATAIETYLTNPTATDDEKRAFFAIFPLRAATTGYRLYASPPEPYQRSQVVADDQAALATVERWLADPALAALQPELSALRGRLFTWTSQSRP